MNKRAVGTLYEEKAVEVLKNRGYSIIERNFRCKIGEIDLIARHGVYLVFIEVKYRSNKRQGLPVEAVTATKMRTICKVSDYYRMKLGIGEQIPIRFDVVAIQGDLVHVYENAFSYVR